MVRLRHRAFTSLKRCFPHLFIVDLQMADTHQILIPASCGSVPDSV